ncbi:MAG: prolipoprotein diacylglyceryl transferase, partial [Clostridia bacterium]|nr:prolipoprotein diacylglyceryl transferase [Clostridia bacterium]
KALPADTAVDLCLIALPCGVVGARLGYVLTHLSAFRGRAIETLYLWDGGLSLIGAAALALIGILIYALKKKLCFFKLIDALAPAVCAALAVSCWGHFFNQDFYGPAVESRALKWFPLCVRLESGDIHLALFFYLFVWLVLLFACLWFFLRKRARHDGDAAFAFILAFSPALGVLTLLRRDAAAGATSTAILCAALFILALLWFLLRERLLCRCGAQAQPVEAWDADAAEAAGDPGAEESLEAAAQDAAEPPAADETLEEAEAAAGTEAENTKE